MLETGPTSSKKPGDDADESDCIGRRRFLLTSCSGAASEDPVPVPHPPQADDMVRRSQIGTRPPFWTRDYQLDISIAILKFSRETILDIFKFRT